MITVMKFGGTSVGSVEAMSQTADIIRSTPNGKVVVVSAMSGVTNRLIGLIGNDSADVDQVLRELRQRHLDAVGQLMSESRFADYTVEFDGLLGPLTELLEERNNINDRPHVYDAISSYGERLSALNMAYILNDRGQPAVRMCSEDAGIVAEGPPRYGSAELELTSKNLKASLLPLIDQGVVPVLTGFYGMDCEGRPLTFGRGGSDYSAAVVAHAVGADMLEIWTDVDGFMTADPRVVPEARTISEMNYGEAADLAYFGAKVLHPRTIEPVRRRDIPLRVRNTFNPEGQGTVIHRLRGESTSLLRSVAMMRDLSIVKIYAPEVAYRMGLVANIIQHIDSARVTTYALSSSLSTLAFVIPTQSVAGVVEIIERVEGDKVENITVKDGVALVCAVGDDLIDSCGASGRIFGAVQMAGANVELISEGASDVALNFVVPDARCENVIRELHQQLIG